MNLTIIYNKQALNQTFSNKSWKMSIKKHSNII
jgi:hypothetical protein